MTEYVLYLYNKIPNFGEYWGNIYANAVTNMPSSSAILSYIHKHIPGLNLDIDKLPPISDPTLIDGTYQRQKHKKYKSRFLI